MLSWEIVYKRSEMFLASLNTIVRLEAVSIKSINELKK